MIEYKPCNISSYLAQIDHRNLYSHILLCSVDEIGEDADVSEEEDDSSGNESVADEDRGSGAEDEWSSIKDDDLIQPEKLLEMKSKESHIVHSPYFPMVCYLIAL